MKEDSLDLTIFETAVGPPLSGRRHCSWCWREMGDDEGVESEEWDLILRCDSRNGEESGDERASVVDIVGNVVVAVCARSRCLVEVEVEERDADRGFYHLKHAGKYRSQPTTARTEPEAKCFTVLSFTCHFYCLLVMISDFCSDPFPAAAHRHGRLGIQARADDGPLHSLATQNIIPKFSRSSSA